MKIKLTLVIAAVLTLFQATLILTAEQEVDLKTDAAKLSYALGLEIGANLKTLPTELDFGTFVRGLEDSFKGNEPLLTAEVSQKIREEFAQKRRADRIRRLQELGGKNREAGAAFLAENARLAGVVTTDSGLQYIVIKEGDGAMPIAESRVRVHYRGTLVDGTEFDSSYNRGEPTSFGVNRVIPGWTEGLQLMEVGSEYRFFIPSDLAYGTRGSPPKIGPNETLIFEVELLGVDE